jgi:hypothetical protein
LLQTLAHSLKDIANFAVFLFLFIFIFTLLAMELFAYRAKFEPDSDIIDEARGVSPTFNFDTFLNSFSLVFIILTNDGQAAVYYNYYRTVGPAPATIFFVLLVMVGQKIIINLFVAILLENFDEAALRQKLHDFEEKQMGTDAKSRMQNFIKSVKEQVVKWSFERCRRIKRKDNGLRMTYSIGGTARSIEEQNGSLKRSNCVREEKNEKDKKKLRKT